MPATVILIHGAFCTATAWAPLQRELDSRGISNIAVDLPGHGTHAPLPAGYAAEPQQLESLARAPSAMAGIGTSDDVAAVCEVLRAARAHGPTVLVGASRGGMTLTAVANTAPELVDHLVYAAAWCCVDQDPQAYEQSEENCSSELGLVSSRLVCADPAQIGAIRLNWRTQDEQLLRSLQSALLHDGTRAELLTYLHAQDPDESIIIDTELVVGDPATWGRVPRSYVVTGRDRAMPPALQERFIAEADAAVPDNPTTVHHLASSHLGFQIHPAGLADILHGIVE